jgi:hypothetical protein
MRGACRAEVARREVLDARVLEPLLGLGGARPLVGRSMSDESGVVRREGKEGRSRDFRDGEGGRGTGGLL